jgi:hypothetical protein
MAAQRARRHERDDHRRTMASRLVRVEERLRHRGWLDAAGALTDRGRTGRQAVEDRTDALAMPPWELLGAERSARLRELVWPLSDAIVRQGGIPMPNPLGLSWP